MSQAPAIPKKTRFLQVLATSILGKPLSLRETTPAEVAALELRKARQAEKWSTPDHVTFMIPLVSPTMVGDWTVVEDLLNHTLKSFQRQADPRWRAVICCQVKPGFIDDPRITFLSFEEAIDGNDKWAKLAALYKALGHGASDAGLTMTFDADDVAHPDLVKNLLCSATGTLVTHGIIYDVQSDLLGQSKPQSLFTPGAKAFWKLCGSCAALPYDASQSSFAHQAKFLSAVSQHEHRMVPYLATLAGLKLVKQRDSLVLYLLNHGENFGARRGRVNYKTRFVDRFAIKDPERLKSLRSVFALSSYRTK